MRVGFERMALLDDTGSDGKMVRRFLRPLTVEEAAALDVEVEELKRLRIAVRDATRAEESQRGRIGRLLAALVDAPNQKVSVAHRAIFEEANPVEKPDGG